MGIGIGIGLSGWPFGESGAQQFWDYVDLAESLHIDSLWLSDRVVSDALSLEPVVALACVVARTRHMKVGTSVLALPLRNPTVLAKELSTLDFLSEGRLLLAVGLGRDEDREPRACGIARQERAARTEEMIHLIRRLWLEPEVTFDGKFYHLDHVAIEPKPVQKPPPIWIGGRSRAAFRRTARLADGWLVSQVTPEEVRAGIAAIKGYGQEYGRSIDVDHFGVLFNFCFARNPREGAAAAGPYALRNRPDLDFTECSAFGSTKDITAMIRHYIDAGASKFVARPTCPPAEIRGQLERLASEVIPEFENSD